MTNSTPSHTVGNGSTTRLSDKALVGDRGTSEGTSVVKGDGRTGSDQAPVNPAAAAIGSPLDSQPSPTVPPRDGESIEQQRVASPNGNGTGVSAAPSSERVPFAAVLKNLEFRTLFIAQFFSLAGDQLARVALTVLVFNRTNSALEAAIAYALTFIPAVIGGPLLAGLADRRPRRSVMITSDLLRAPLVALLAIPTMPLALELTLLAAVGLFEAPFDAARGALVPDVLPPKKYPTGLALMQILIQVAQVGGFGLAGVLLIGFSPSVLLLLDTATFVLSAVLIARGITRRPAAAGPSGRPSEVVVSRIPDLRLSIGLVLGDPSLRPLAMLAWASATFVVGFEALGAPLARATNSAAWAVGVLFAARRLAQSLVLY